MKTWIFKVGISITENQVKEGERPSLNEVLKAVKSRHKGMEVSCECVITPMFTIQELEDLGLI